jgi:SpoVK/Ycf46/Vps4 family AAA+-type ATPase
MIYIIILYYIYIMITNSIYDQTSYNMYLISMYLNQIAKHTYNNNEVLILHLENTKLKKTLKNNDIEINNLKRQLNEYDSQITNNNKQLKTNLYNKYNLYNYKPFVNSWSDEKINEILLSIKSIDNIISLLKNNNYMLFKHNLILQKLYNLLPALINLQNMVGLTDVKNKVFKNIIYYVKNPYNNEYLHTIISGPPGVGKTDFAKIYADIFIRLGILKSTNFIEVKRDNLIGEYLGSTSIKTKKILEESLGGVLFLDEAYSLGNSEKRDSFSKEAIDMINQYLSEKKGEFMFIIAGYEDDINDCFFSYNKGLKRRFQSHYKIDGYKPNELKDIFIQKLNLTPFKLSLDINILNKFFTENKNLFQYYGGDIEKFINELKQVQSLRTFNNNLNNKEIIMEDLENSLVILQNQRERFDSNVSMYT